MGTEDVFYMYNGVFFSHEKKGNCAICGNLNGPYGHYAQWNKSEENKYTVLYDLTYMTSMLKS